MPVYIGKGNIYARIVQASRSRRRGQFWDYFSCTSSLIRVSATMLKLFSCARSLGISVA